MSRVKEIIAAVLKQRLTGAVYHADNTSSWAREIADDIKRRLKGVTGSSSAWGQGPRAFLSARTFYHMTPCCNA